MINLLNLPAGCAQRKGLSVTRYLNYLRARGTILRLLPHRDDILHRRDTTDSPTVNFTPTQIYDVHILTLVTTHLPLCGACEQSNEVES